MTALGNARRVSHTRHPSSDRVRSSFEQSCSFGEQGTAVACANKHLAEAYCSHVPVAEFLELACQLVEHALAIALGRVAAVAGALVQLLQRVVQVLCSSSFLFSSSRLSVALGCPYVVAGVSWSGKCFCPSRTSGRCGNYEGHGTPLPFCAEVFLLAAAARGIGTDGACCCKSVHRVEPLSQGPEVRQKTPWLTWPAGSGRGQIALHGLRF